MQNRTMKDMFNLRLPDGLRDYIKEQAAQDRRSMNAQIIYLLENAVRRDAAQTNKGEAA